MSHFVKESATEVANFIASEVGLRMVTCQVDATGITADANGKKTVVAGTIVTGKGVIFQDVDVTNGEHEASLIVAGHIINNKLPKAASSEQVTAFAAQGLFFETADTTERPSA